MDKKTIVLLIIAIGLIGAVAAFFFNPKKSLLSPVYTQPKEIASVIPSETLKTYSDPAGFSFDYPDNLSLVNGEVDESTYADLKLTAGGVEGQLSLKITDSKLASIEDWVKTIGTSSQTPKEVDLGNLKAQQIETGDKLLLGALDQGVLFNVEIPLSLSNKAFWMNVYTKFLKDFSFAPPSGGTALQGSSDDITFEGEEVIE